MDAFECAVGAHETGSDRKLVRPLPVALIGVSSTARELQAMLDVVHAWGERCGGYVNHESACLQR